jgi:hypothetical protein
MTRASPAAGRRDTPEVADWSDSTYADRSKRASGGRVGAVQTFSLIEGTPPFGWHSGTPICLLSRCLRAARREGVSRVGDALRRATMMP